LRPIRSAAFTVLATVVLAGSVTGCQFVDEEEAAGEIVIAADLELSGAGATTGKLYQRALELKAQQLNESGALGERTLRLEIKDNRSDPNESLRNINDFAANPAVQGIIMGDCDACAVDAAKTLADQRVPAITLAAATEVVTPVADRRYLFKLAPNAGDNAAALTAELKRQRIRRVGLLYTDDSYGKDGREAMDAELAKADIKLVDDQSIRPAASEVSQAVSALVEKNPDALVIWTTADQAALAADNARDAGFDGELFFDAKAAGHLFLDSAVAKSTNGTVMVFTQTMVIDDVIATTPAKAARKQWFQDYTARYGSYYGFSSFAADALQLIVDAALRAGSGSKQADRDAIRSILETSQMDGLSGPIRITPDNHSGLMPQALTMLVARNGRWRLAG
jgi:branched-chain amino acid transport system substrate-binding protein